MKGAGNRTYYVAKQKGEETPKPTMYTSPLRKYTSSRRIYTRCTGKYTSSLRSCGPVSPPSGPGLAKTPCDLLIRAFSAWKAFSARSLGKILGDRDPKNFVRNHLGPMVEAGELAYTIPEMLNHPDQKYTSPGDGAE